MDRHKLSNKRSSVQRKANKL